MNDVVRPSALHLGSTLALVSTIDADGRPMLRPVSAWFTTGPRLWFGFERPGQTRSNLLREGDCVVNVCSVDLAPAAQALQRALAAADAGDGFGCAGLTPRASDVVRAPRVEECPVQIEGRLVHLHRSPESDAAVAELSVVRVHAARGLTDARGERFVQSAWRPLVYTLGRFRATAPLGPSGELSECDARAGRSRRRVG